MTSQNGLKIFNFYFSTFTFANLKPKKYQIILFLSRDTIVTMLKFVTKGEFI